MGLQGKRDVGVRYLELVGIQMSVGDCRLWEGVGGGGVE